MHHRKNLSFLFSFGLHGVLNSCISQPCDVKKKKKHGDPTFYYLFYHHLDLLHQCTKFHPQSMLGSFTKESP